MPDEADALPTGRIARWVALAVVIAFAVALYFRAGVRLAPLTTPPRPPRPPVPARRRPSSRRTEPMSAPEIRVTLPDGSERRLPAGSTGADLAKAIGPGLAKAALAVRVDGQVRDLSRPLPDGMKVAILTDKDAQALDVLRPSSAPLLATAVRQLFPHARIGFGPPIADGFYYDF